MYHMIPTNSPNYWKSCIKSISISQKKVCLQKKTPKSLYLVHDDSLHSVVSECRCGLSVIPLDNLLFSSFRSRVGTWGGGLVFFCSSLLVELLVFTSFGNFNIGLRSCRHQRNLSGWTFTSSSCPISPKPTPTQRFPLCKWNEFLFSQKMLHICIAHVMLLRLHKPHPSQVTDCHIYPCIDAVCTFTMIITNCSTQMWLE